MDNIYSARMTFFSWKYNIIVDVILVQINCDINKELHKFHDI